MKKWSIAQVQSILSLVPLTAMFSLFFDNEFQNSILAALLAACIPVQACQTAPEEPTLLAVLSNSSRELNQAPQS